MFLLFEALGVIGIAGYGVFSMRYHANKPYRANSIAFKDFVVSYNLNPKRWNKYKDYVEYRNDMTTEKDDEKFYFRTFYEYLQYKKWLTRHSTAYERMMFWMKKDLMAIPPADSDQADRIQLALDIINKTFPNIDNKFNYLLED